eukprot:UN24316
MFSRFWLQKDVENLVWHVSYPQLGGKFIYFFLLITILSSQKLKNEKYSFWLKKQVQNTIRCVFYPRPPNNRWFHLLFLIHQHFVKPKAEKRKIPFLVTK